MYIHQSYNICNPSAPIKLYKDELKAHCNLNLRRSSKFNILGRLGALKCMQNQSFSSNMGIYVASEYGAMNSVKKVLESISNQEIVMPFDFLNINTNNIGFYVSQSLQAKGKNMVITAHHFSFEKALEVALFELEIGEVKDILVGIVDESLEEIQDYKKYLNSSITHSYDTSSWIYLNSHKEKAVGKIHNFTTLCGVDSLYKYLDENTFSHINLSNYAKSHLTISSHYCTSNENNFVNLLSLKKDVLHIAMDENENFTLIELKFFEQ